METAPPSFSSRRPAANALPHFSLPPPPAEVPRVSEGLSPLSSVNTGSSQGSQAPAALQYPYSSGQVNGSWPTPNSSYTISSAAPPTTQHSLSHQQFGARPSLYGQPSNLQQFSHPRSSQSPATAQDGLPPPPFDQVHHPFQTSMAGGGGGGGQGTATSMPSGPQPPQSAILNSQNPVSTQPPASSAAPAPIDSYAHSRPSTTPSYYTTSSTSQQPSFPAYAHPSPTQPSPTTSGPVPRALQSLAGPHQGPGMAPPAPYRPYPQYSALSAMGGSVMSNIHQPGSQMSMIHGIGVPPYGHMMYGNHGQQPTQSERPFKCDQCVQSFSRNHDLKRHKRIHLAVKPFPCTYCSKSFSRKDALKRHRLVKGCEGKMNDNSNNNHNNNNGPDGNGPDRNGEADDTAEIKKEA